MSLGTNSQALRDFDRALSYNRQWFTKTTSDGSRVFKIAMAQSHHGRAVIYAAQGYELKYQREAEVARESGNQPGLFETGITDNSAGD